MAMNELDFRTWQRYATRHPMSRAEYNNDDLCDALRKTTGFALLRASIAMNDAIRGILCAFTSRSQTNPSTEDA